MRKLNQTGFSAVEALLIIIVLGILSFTGWFVYHSKQSTDKTLSNNGRSSIQQPIKTTTKNTDTVAPEQEYLVITEWGIKIKMRDAYKATYEYRNEASSDSAGKYDSLTALKVRPQYLQDKSCEVSVGMYRSASKPDVEATLIGNYYYRVSGSPYNCGNDSDNQLNQSLRMDFTPSNIQQL